MKLFNKVAIVGVGLIGGSIGLTLKKKPLCSQVIGVSSHESTLKNAKKMKAIDSGSRDLKVIKEADLVVLAAPVGIIMKLAPLISRIIKRDCLVVDVGSTKEKIVSELERLFPNYVGSHPLAGSELRGIKNARCGLFKGSTVLLTPTARTKKPVLNKIKKFWAGLGAKVFFISPALHDKVLSFTSHLPHIAAFSLIGVIPENFLKFSSGGLKDTTRIAASDAGLWEDIFLSNRENILASVRLFEKRIAGIKSAIGKNDGARLRKILTQARKKRELLDDYCH